MVLVRGWIPEIPENEKDCYFETPQANPKPPIQSTNLTLVETYGSEKNVKNAAQQVSRGSMHVPGG